MAALVELCRRFNVRRLDLFGSAARGEFKPDSSDLDFLVSFEPDAGWDLWDLVTMRDELIAAAGREVDIVVKEALRNPYRRREILAHREIVHAA